MIKWYGPTLDIVVSLLAIGCTVRYSFDHGQYQTSVVFLLTAIFLKLGIIANKE